MKGKYLFVADEHYGHKNIIKYCDRPFADVDEMDKTLISNHNSVVRQDDMVIHAGDFTLMRKREDVQKKYVRHLNGKHVFLMGSHDYWLKGWGVSQIWETKIQKKYVVVCHYAIGVDNNNFFPLSSTQIINIMEKRPDNPNLIRRN